MIRLSLVATMVVVNAVIVIHERMEGRIDGHGQRPNACHGLHHLGLVQGRQVDEAGTVTSDFRFAESATSVPGFVRIRFFGINSTVGLKY